MSNSKPEHIFRKINQEGFQLPQNLISKYDTLDFENLIGYIFSHLNSKCVIIDGGHYQIQQTNSQIIHAADYLTYSAFSLALMLHQKCLSKSFCSELSFLINDLGITSDFRNILKEDFTIHPEYSAVLDKANQRLRTDLLFFESSLRNRAARNILKRGIKMNYVKIKNDVLYVPEISSHTKMSFSNEVGYRNSENLKDRTPIPYCRAIMTQKLLDLDSKFKTDLVHLYFLTEKEFKCLGNFANLYHFLGGKNDVLIAILSNYEMPPEPLEETVKTNSLSPVTFTVKAYSKLRFFVNIKQYVKP